MAMRMRRAATDADRAAVVVASRTPALAPAVGTTALALPTRDPRL